MCVGLMRRRHWFQYIDFLHYAWVAQMVNQFEHTQIFVFLDLEVSCLPSGCLKWCKWSVICNYSNATT